MKHILLFLLLAMPVLLFAQYPTTGNKQRLGWQTTGDGLVYRDAGPPSYTPNSRNNAYIYLDTIAKRYYHFSSGAWRYLSAEKYIRLQDVTVGAAAVADSLITYDRLFYAADLTSGASSDKAVQLPIAGLDSTYAGRVVRLSVIDSSATYGYAITSSSPDGLLVGDTLATSYSVENGETAEFQLYVFDTIYQWRLIHTSRADSLILPDSLAYGTGTTNYLSRWIAPFTLGTAGISDDGNEIQFARPTVLYGVNTAAAATYGTFGIDNTLGIERPTYYNGSAWVPWLAYSGGTNQYSYFSNSNTITSGTQLYRDANGVNIGDGNYFRLPSNSTVGSQLGTTPGRVELNSTADNFSFRTSTATEYPVKSADATGLGTANSFAFYDTNGRLGTQPILQYLGDNRTLIFNANNPIIQYLSGQLLFRRGASKNIVQFYGTTTTNDIPIFSVRSGGIDWMLMFSQFTSNASGGFTKVGNNGRLGVGRFSTATESPAYSIDVRNATDAIGFPGGTTPQRPTVISGTHPARVNSDSLFWEGYDGTVWQMFASRNWVRANFATVGSGYSGFTPAADSGTGSNVASGGTLEVNGSGSISTSVSDTIITIDNNRFGNYTYTEDSIIVDGTNFFGDGIAVYKGFLFSMSNSADSLYVFDIYNDYNVVSKFPVAGTSSPSIHAWNNRLIVTRSDSIRVYDIKDLKNPILLHKQRSSVLNFPAQYNQFVFSSGGTNDIYIFNTETFQTDTVIVPRSNVFQANSLAYDDGYLYAVGVDASPDSIFIVNTNTKSYVNAYGQDGVGTTTYIYIFAQDKYLYALRSDTIDILNLADPENPVLVSKTKSFLGNTPFTRGLKVYGNYLIHCFSGGGFVVYDISDKTNVVPLDTVYTTIASNTRGFDIYDNKIYLLSRNEPTIVVYDLPSIETGHLRSATIHTGKVRAENLITKEIEVQGLVTTDLVVNSNVIFSDYGAGNKTATALSKTDSGYRLGLATDGTVIEIPDSTPKTHIITRTIYDGDAALPDSTVTVNGTFNAGFWRVPESMDGYTLTKASFGIFDKGDMSTSGATYSFGVQKCNGSNMSCSNSSNVNFTPSSETELELSISITLNANDILRVNYQPPQGCVGGCGTENVNGLVVTYTIQEN